MSPKAFLSLMFDAPMQSWGYQSRYDRRTTLSYPTRSGIIGMLCAAMGIDREDDRGLARFRDLTITVYVFSPGELLTDFHTIGGGYDFRTERSFMSRKADGGKPSTVVSHREYLTDATFGAVLTGDRELLGEIGTALNNPRWGVWFGRKSCIPAAMIVRGMHGSIEEAEEHLESSAGMPVTRFVEDAPSFARGTDTLMDIPLSFNERRFAPRRVSVEFPEEADDGPV